MGDLVIWDAVMTYAAELQAKERRERAAWRAAERATEEALKG